MSMGGWMKISRTAGTRMKRAWRIYSCALEGERSMCSWGGQSTGPNYVCVYWEVKGQFRGQFNWTRDYHWPSQRLWLLMLVPMLHSNYFKGKKSNRLQMTASSGGLRDSGRELRLQTGLQDTNLRSILTRLPVTFSGWHRRVSETLWQSCFALGEAFQAQGYRRVAWYQILPTWVICMHKLIIGIG